MFDIVTTYESADTLSSPRHLILHSVADSELQAINHLKRGAAPYKKGLIPKGTVP